MQDLKPLTRKNNSHEEVSTLFNTLCMHCTLPGELEMKVNYIKLTFSEAWLAIFEAFCAKVDQPCEIQGYVIPVHEDRYQNARNALPTKSTNSRSPS